MESELKNEDILMRIRSKLNSEKIKLWLDPFVSNGISNDTEIDALGKKYCTELDIPEADVICALKELQTNSIERAAANDEYKETGVALLRLKVPPQATGNKVINIKIKLAVTGNELVDVAAEKLDVDSIRLKLIHRGSVIKRDETLQQQGIKNGAQILVIVLSETPEKLRQDSDLYSLMQSTRSDVELLIEQSDTQYMQLEDQYGNRVELPASEKKALTLGMALHERGRKELKDGNYPLALVLLLEADKYFSECNAKILESVDNYALLNLDISWCYLCLQSITHIPDAEARLTKCEENFHQSYGRNLERLVALKGSSANEQALLMRLHLLQSIILYHQNKRTEAKRLLEQTERELNSLKVDEVALNTMLELGCTPAEGRMGLRTQNNNVEAAYSFVQNMREERKANRKRAKEEQESRLLGLCMDGKQFVSSNFVKMLQSMGYPWKTAVLALRQSNNHVSNAVQIIQEHPHMLNEADLPTDVSRHFLKDDDTDDNLTAIDDEAITTLAGMGFDVNMVQKALLQNNNMVEKAADYLIKNFPALLNSAGGSASTSSSSSGAKMLKDEIKKQKKVKEAYNRLAEGMDTQDDNYLDITLQQEEEFLIQYKDLLL